MLKKSWYNFLIFLFAIGLLGCAAKLPKQTETYTVLLGNQIAEGKLNHLSVIDGWKEMHIKNAEQYLEYVYNPGIVRKMMEPEGKPFKMLKEAMKNKCEGDKTDIVLAIVKSVSKKIELKRVELLSAIRKAAQELKVTVNQNYADIERMHRMILSGIQTVIKGQSINKTIQDAMLKPLKEVVPFDKATEGINKLMKKGEKLK